MPDWTEHADVFPIPDVSEECDAKRPAISWRILQYANSCRRECEKIKKKRRTDWPQIVAIMHKLSMAGRIRNEEQFKHEFEDVYAIKSRRGIRALGVLESRGIGDSKPVFVVLNWFEKRRKALNKHDVKRAQMRRKDFEEFILEYGGEN